MTRWTKPIVEVTQLIGPDGKVFDLTTESNRGNWVLESSGWGMPGVDYITQQGPFQHGVSVRDYRLKPRTIQLLVRQQACDRDDYWDRRTELLNAVRPNRDEVGLAGVWFARSQINTASPTTNLPEIHIVCLVEYNNKLYGGTSDHGLLFEWDGSYSWIPKAEQLNAQTYIWSMVVYDDGGGADELYGGTRPGGRLFKWDGSSAWSQVCAALGAETDIYDMLVFDDGLGGGDQIFAGTGPNGNLYYYNVGGPAWVQACAQLGAETDIYSLCKFDDGGGDAIFGGTGPGGRLYKYNPAGPAWTQVCAQLNGQINIYDLIVYSGQLYGCTGTGGRLFRYDVAGGAWEQVAPQYGVVNNIRSLAVYQGRLYGLGDSCILLRWNGTDAWELAASQYSNESGGYGRSLYKFNNRLFGGTTNDALLLEYIRRAGDTNLPCSTLRRILSDGSIRDLCVLIDNGPQFSVQQQGWDEHGIQELLRLWAPDPIVYDPTLQSGPTYTMDPGATGNVNETQTLTYSPTWEEHPTLTLTGPMTSPVIRNEDTDEYIELDYTIPSGRVVTITLTPGNQMVENDLGVNLIGVITPESNLSSFHLAPDPEVANGENDISIISDGTNAATGFSISYYNRYIGI